VSLLRASTTSVTEAELHIHALGDGRERRRDALIEVHVVDAFAPHMSTSPSSMTEADIRVELLGRYTVASC
jgi:hypothetical protein